MWPGPSRGLLRDPTQSQYIKANVANSHRLVQIKLYNRNLLGRAFMAKKTSAVTTVGSKERKCERGSREQTAARHTSTARQCPIRQASPRLAL